MSYGPLPVIQENGNWTIGIPPIIVSEDQHCDECNKRHDFEKCPLCGSWIGLGFGLMFGGYGSYKYCERDCGWFFKITYPADIE